MGITNPTIDARSRRVVLGVSAGAAALLLAATAAANAQVSQAPDQGVPKLAGSGYALAQSGDRTFIGGVYTKLGGKDRQNIGAYVTSTGTVDAAFLPSTNGKVDAIAVSEDGTRVFLGGKFTTVNGEPRANLAAVDATTGALVEAWRADTSGTNPDVRTLLVNGDRLYVGGRFGGIDGTTTRPRLAAVTVGTGDLDSSFRPRPAGGVNEIRLSPDGSELFVGGAFTALGGQPRPALGSVYTSSGAATPFNPQSGGGNAVTIELSPDGQRLWHGTDNNTIYAFDPYVSDAPAYSFKMSGNTQAMAASDSVLYFGGHFSQSTTEKAKRYFFAAVEADTGSLTSWNPDAAGGKMGVWDLMIEGDRLHAAGVFSTFAGGTISQRGYARFTGTP